MSNRTLMTASVYFGFLAILFYMGVILAGCSDKKTYVADATRSVANVNSGDTALVDSSSVSPVVTITIVFQGGFSEQDEVELGETVVIVKQFFEQEINIDYDVTIHIEDEHDIPPMDTVTPGHVFVFCGEYNEMPCLVQCLGRDFERRNNGLHLGQDKGSEYWALRGRRLAEKIRAMRGTK